MTFGAGGFSVGLTSDTTPSLTPGLTHDLKGGTEYTVTVSSGNVNFRGFLARLGHATDSTLGSFSLVEGNTDYKISSACETDGVSLKDMNVLDGFCFWDG